jgi:pSer/pThr/pTyr-binding forkhead associated (FHA) protein
MTSNTRGVTAFLVYGDESGYQRTFALDAAAERVRIGRGAGVELRLPWDRQASRVHAELQRLGEGWALSDDGLSANGTYVNGERLHGRRRLTNGDRIQVGQTQLVFRAMSAEGSSTFVPALSQPPVELSRMQERVLIALSRPYRSGAMHALPATNREIADELSLSVDAVKTHLRVLFGKFGIAGLPQNQKRARLVELAFARGNITDRDLEGERHLTA